MPRGIRGPGSLENWKNPKAGTAFHFTRGDGQSTGQVRVTLAKLPASEFTVYWKRQKHYPKGDKVWRKRHEEDRAKLGWLPNGSLETAEHKFLEHKYFRVRHYPI